MPKLPQVSGDQLLKGLKRLGYKAIRSRGSHVRIMKELQSGNHYATIPMHRVIDKGTLHGILTDICEKNNISVDQFLRDYL